VIFSTQQTDICLPKRLCGWGLWRITKPRLVGGLSFRRNEDGGYDYREGRAISFVGRTLHNDIDLAAECERLGAASGGDERYA
jgi:hypothetical protein